MKCKKIANDIDKLRNIDMINNLVREDVNYCHYGSGTRPVAKESLDYAFKIAKALGLKKVEEIENFDNIDVFVYSSEDSVKNSNVISYNSGNYMLIVPTSSSKASWHCKAGYGLDGYRNYQN